MLRCKEKNVFLVEYCDMERFIDEEFGVGFEEKYEMATLEETSNYTWKSFDVDENMTYEWDVESINEMLYTRKYKKYSTRVILNYLCRQNKLKPGQYLVDVSW